MPSEESLFTTETDRFSKEGIFRATEHKILLLIMVH